MAATTSLIAEQRQDADQSGCVPGQVSRVDSQLGARQGVRNSSEGVQDHRAVAERVRLHRGRVLHVVVDTQVHATRLAKSVLDASGDLRSMTAPSRDGVCLPAFRVRRIDVRPILSRHSISDGLTRSAWSRRAASDFSETARC
jgi:hypothetical protein